MKVVKFNLTGKRRPLVEAISEITGYEARYKGAPGFEFVVGCYVVSADGMFSIEGEYDESAIGTLLAQLTGRGFVYEDIRSNVDGGFCDAGDLTASSDESGFIGKIIVKAGHDELEAVSNMESFAGGFFPEKPEAAYSAAAPQQIETVDGGAHAYYLMHYPDNPAMGAVLNLDTLSLIQEPADSCILCAEPTSSDYITTEPSSSTDGYTNYTTGNTDMLSIDVPLDGMNPTAIANLENLITSKAWIIKKMTGAVSLPIELIEDRLRFPWFKQDASHKEIDAYSCLISRLCETAKAKKRIAAKESLPNPGDNEKYKARCFLLSIDFIGPDYKEARRILLSHMSGNGSFLQGTSKKEATPVVLPYDKEGPAAESEVGDIDAADSALSNTGSGDVKTDYLHDTYGDLGHAEYGGFERDAYAIKEGV